MAKKEEGGKEKGVNKEKGVKEKIVAAIRRAEEELGRAPLRDGLAVQGGDFIPASGDHKLDC